MADETSRPVRLVDLIIPVGAVAYAVYYNVSVADFPFEARITGLLLGTILALLCGAYFIRYALAARRRGAIGDLSHLLGSGTLAMQRHPAVPPCAGRRGSRGTGRLAVLHRAARHALSGGPVRASYGADPVKPWTS